MQKKYRIILLSAFPSCRNIKKQAPAAGGCIIWRRIEVVITGRTRNVVRIVERCLPEMPMTGCFLPNGGSYKGAVLMAILIKLNNRLIPYQELTYTETYRSGHNGAHSKCVSPKGLEGSNPSVSAGNNLFCLSLQKRFFRFELKMRKNKCEMGFGTVNRLFRSPFFMFSTRKNW